MLALAKVGPVDAQQQAGWHELTAGSDLEEYLRALQLSGKVPLYPFSLRGFSPRELDRLVPADTGHPWAGLLRAPRAGRGAASIRRPELRTGVNSGAPRAANDGAVWAGRGLTTSFSAGVVYRTGPLSVILHPTFFWTQNAQFRLSDNGTDGNLRFADSRFYQRIDLPQRFGDVPYARLDPGQSAIRLDLPAIAVGLSTENEIWGPSSNVPLILGASAPGIPRFFIGTSEPLNVGLGRLHVRLLLGQLAQSQFSIVPADSGRRMASGLAAVFTPRGLPGVELGATRFIHRYWPGGGVALGDLFLPFGTVVKRENNDLGSTDNEIGSVFFRIATAGGVEVYGEYATDDLSYNASPGVIVRELATEPDHDVAYTLGFRRVWAGPRRMTVLRTELYNARISHLQRLRDQVDVYLHTPIRQGHTHHGQLLAGAVPVGGEALHVAVDRYTPLGRWTVAFRREGWATSAETDGTPPNDVVYGVDASSARWLGHWEVEAGLGLSIPVNPGARDGAGGIQLTTRVRRGLPAFTGR
jgi:hypothetical protein